MFRKTLSIAFVAVVALLATSSRVYSWGGAHAGYTHVGPNGVYHAGGTVDYGGSRYGGYRYGDAYHYGARGYGAGYGGGYYYGGYPYGGYYYGGYPYRSYGDVRGGYIRRW